MRRAAIVLAILAVLVLAGCGSSSSGTAATTTTKQATTTTSTAPKPSGQALVTAIKAMSMDGDPMMLPLVDAEWKGGFLVLTYQEDDPETAANLCDLIRNAPPAGLTSADVEHLQVIGPGNRELAVSRLSGPGCKPK